MLDVELDVADGNIGSFRRFLAFQPRRFGWIDGNRKLFIGGVFRSAKEAIGVALEPDGGRCI
jgi:hypothetical protein